METTPALHIRLLREEFAKRCERNPRYSMRAFALFLQISQGALSEILQGKRIPSPKLLRRISERLSADPKVFADLIRSAGQIQKKRNLRRINPLYRTESSRKTPFRPRDLSVDLYRVIADWYHSALLELTFVDGFQADPKWISKALGISISEASLALERLLDLQLLEQADGRVKKAQTQTTTADKHLTTPALRKHQKQMLEKAIYSLEHDPIDVRDITGMTMSIDPDLLPEARERIQKFTLELMDFLESKSRRRVYQMEISLFPIQKNINTE